MYREVRAGSSAGYPVGHLVMSVPGENLTQNLRLQGAGPWVKSLWVSRVPKTAIVSRLVSQFFLWVCQLVTPSCQSDQTRPDPRLAPVYFGIGLALFGIPILPFQGNLTVPPPHGIWLIGFPDFALFGPQVPYHSLELSGNSALHHFIMCQGARAARSLYSILRQLLYRRTCFIGRQGVRFLYISLLPLLSVLLLIMITGSEHSPQSQARSCHV